MPDRTPLVRDGQLVAADGLPFRQIGAASVDLTSAGTTVLAVASSGEVVIPTLLIIRATNVTGESSKAKVICRVRDAGATEQGLVLPETELKGAAGHASWIFPIQGRSAALATVSWDVAFVVSTAAVATTYTADIFLYGFIQ